MNISLKNATVKQLEAELNLKKEARKKAKDGFWATENDPDIGPGIILISNGKVVCAMFENGRAVVYEEGEDFTEIGDWELVKYLGKTINQIGKEEDYDLLKTICNKIYGARNYTLDGNAVSKFLVEIDNWGREENKN
tara:strand:+ start:61846 stop:62256 length:411 start_codon:yes stop_codon:yes gene_type:complete